MFFKWIKQHLRMKAFFGTDENAVKTQVWIAISVYVLVAILKRELKIDRNWRVRCGLADTVGTAWALAHYARQSVTIAPIGQSEVLLRSLPVAALRLPDGDLSLLAELGIARVDQLLALPRAELASRFEQIVPKRLRQALGIEAELLVPVRVPEPIVARWATEGPVCDLLAIERLCGQLLDNVLRTCQEQGIGLVQCLCRLSATGKRESYGVELVRPSHNREHILNLLRLQWEQRPFPAAVHSICLEATQTRLSDRQSGILFDAGHAADERAINRLVECLSSKLGKDCVLQASSFPDAQPESSIAWPGPAHQNLDVRGELRIRCTPWPRASWQGAGCREAEAGDGSIHGRDSARSL